MPLRPILPGALPVLPDDLRDTDQALTLRDGELFRSPFPAGGGEAAPAPDTLIVTEYLTHQLPAEQFRLGFGVRRAPDGQVVPDLYSLWAVGPVWGIYGGIQADTGLAIVHRRGFFNIQTALTARNAFFGTILRNVDYIFNGPWQFLITGDPTFDNYDQLNFNLFNFAFPRVRIGKLLDDGGRDNRNIFPAYLDLTNFTSSEGVLGADFTAFSINHIRQSYRFALPPFSVYVEPD